MPRIALSVFFLALVPLAAQTEDLALQSRRGKELMEAGRFEEAIPVYSGLVKALPGNTGLLFNLALAEATAGHLRKAIPHLEAVLKAVPAHVPALTTLARARLGLQQPRQALGPLHKLAAVEPRNPEAFRMLAGALAELNRLEEAAGYYRKLTVLEAGDARAWYGLGKAYESLAVEAFDRLGRLAPDSAYSAALLADSRLQRKQYRSAYFFYRKALDKLPSLSGLHAGLARVYRNTKHEDWAAQEDARERALAAPDCRAHPGACGYLAGRFLESARAARGSAAPEALFWASKAYNMLAVETYAKLGGLPESVEIHAIKAEMLQARNHRLESANEWRAALRLAPDHPQLLVELARALFMAGDYESSRPLLEAQLRASPASPQANFMLGAALLRTGQPERAIPYLEAALRADPGMLAAHGSLGLSLARVGRAGEAIPHLEKALELDDDGSLHYQLASACRSAGNAVRARSAMDQYREIVRKKSEQQEELAREMQVVPPQ